MVLVLLTAGINVSLFVLIRGRWDRAVPAFALAALVGAAIGNAAGDLMRFHLLRIGDFNFLAASAVAQLAMLAALLLGVAFQERQVEETE